MFRSLFGKNSEKPADYASGKNWLSVFTKMAFGDPNEDVRNEAADAVRRNWPGGPEAFEACVSRLIETALRDPDEQKRNFAAVGLIGMGNLAIPQVQELLKTKEPEIRKRAIRIISLIQEDEAKIAARRSPQ